MLRPDADDDDAVAAGAPPVAPPVAAAAEAMQGTQTLVDLACGPWKPSSHWLYAAAVRAAVTTMLNISERFHRIATAGIAAGSSITPQSTVSTEAPQPEQRLPLLPPEIWTFILRFVQRSWWGECKVPSAGIARWPKTLPEATEGGMPAGPTQKALDAESQKHSRADMFQLSSWQSEGPGEGMSDLPPKVKYVLVLNEQHTIRACVRACLRVSVRVRVCLCACVRLCACADVL